MIKNYIFDVPFDSYDKYYNHGDGNCGTSDFSGRGFGGGENVFGKGDGSSTGYGFSHAGGGDGSGSGITYTEHVGFSAFSLPPAIGRKFYHPKANMRKFMR